MIHYNMIHCNIFMVFLLVIVFFSLSSKEGLDTKKMAKPIYANYGIIEKSLEEYSLKFKSLLL